MSTRLDPTRDALTAACDAVTWLDQADGER
jgi:hypothetical protein